MRCNSRAAFIVGRVEISQAKSRLTEAAKVPIAGVEKESPVAREVTAAAAGLETYPMIYGTNSTAAKVVASAITGNGTSLRNVCRSAFRMIAAVASRLVNTGLMTMSRKVLKYRLSWPPMVLSSID